MQIASYYHYSFLQKLIVFTVNEQEIICICLGILPLQDEMIRAPYHILRVIEEACSDVAYAYRSEASELFSTVIRHKILSNLIDSVMSHVVLFAYQTVKA